jgi:hypothetical protein
MAREIRELWYAEKVAAEQHRILMESLMRKSFGEIA